MLISTLFFSVKSSVYVFNMIEELKMHYFYSNKVTYHEVNPPLPS